MVIQQAKAGPDISRNQIGFELLDKPGGGKSFLHESQYSAHRQRLATSPVRIGRGPIAPRVMRG